MRKATRSHVSVARPLCGLARSLSLMNIAPDRRLLRYVLGLSGRCFTPDNL